MVELLVTKLPDVYKPSFIREGVVFEIQALANCELASVIAAKEAKEKKALEEAKALVKTEPVDSDAPAAPIPTPVAGSSRPGPSLIAQTRDRDPTLSMPGSFVSGIPIEDLKPLIGTNGMPSGLAEYIMSKEAGTIAGDASAKKYQTSDPQDVNIVRARVMLMKKLFDTDAGADEGTAALDKLSQQVERLRLPGTSESEIRDTLRDIAGQFTDATRSLSSFELLQSGLIDGLLGFAEVEGTVTSSQRRDILYEEFYDSSNPSSSALVLLVKRLHESLGRLENFEVETAFNGVADASRSSSTLSRTMRIRLQAEDGQDVPKHISPISLTIQAICPISQLNDYLHQRVSTGANHLYGGGSAALAQMLGLGSGARPDRPGSGLGGASGLLSALAASGSSGSGTASAPAGSSSARGGASSLPERGALAAMLGLDDTPTRPAAGSSVGAAAFGSRPATAAGTTNDAAPGPIRRRSARLSAQASEGDLVGAGVGGSGRAAARTAADTEGTADANADPTSGLMSMLGGAPGGAVGAEALFGGMPMDMDFEDEYSDEGDYDAEVSAPAGLQSKNRGTDHILMRQMFDEDMDEELTRPQEKVVNMAVAAGVWSSIIGSDNLCLVSSADGTDGSKVEAQTPDGTRVATPSQAASAAATAGVSTPTARPGATPAAPAAGSSASGAATPRTASYAGAVKTAPTDWHLSFTYDGKPIGYDDTVYGVVHRAQADKAQAQANISSVAAALPGSMGAFGATALFKYKKVPGPAPTGKLSWFHWGSG